MRPQVWIAVHLGFLRRACTTAIHTGLSELVLYRRSANGVDWERNIELGDMYLQTQSREACNVAG